MEVTMLRHGIAVDRADPRCPADFERPLTIDGRNRTIAAIRGLKTLGLRPERILSSPLLRCQQTARLVLRELNLPKRILVTSELLTPGADPRSLWESLAESTLERLLIVGHGGTLEPMAGVALGIPTILPDHGDEPQPLDGRPFDPLARPSGDTAFRALHLKKAGALQLEVQLLPVLQAKLIWHLPPRVLRLLGRA